MYTPLPNVLCCIGDNECVMQLLYQLSLFHHRGKSIHYLQALFTINSKINVSRYWLWGHLKNLTAKIIGTSKVVKHFTHIWDVDETYSEKVSGEHNYVHTLTKCVVLHW